jgi:hypothetical protein
VRNPIRVIKKMRRFAAEPDIIVVLPADHPKAYVGSRLGLPFGAGYGFCSSVVTALGVTGSGHA